MLVLQFTNSGSFRETLRRRIVEVGMSMAAKLSKLGHSLDLGLPTAVKGGGSPERDKPGSTRHRYRLEQLVAGITKRNRHDEVNWGRRVGKEVL